MTEHRSSLPAVLARDRETLFFGAVLGGFASTPGPIKATSSVLMGAKLLELESRRRPPWLPLERLCVLPSS